MTSITAHSASPVSPAAAMQPQDTHRPVEHTRDHPSGPGAVQSQPKKERLCRFFAGDSGCKAGGSCPFSHDASRVKHSRGEPRLVAASSTDTNAATQAMERPVAGRTVPKPVPRAQVDNPREFQLGQIRRRYKPKESLDGNKSTLLDLKMTPSDPDFPFEMAALQCVLVVPLNYPSARPMLKVKNSDIPRGFAINVENGFAGLAESRKDSTLLHLMASLDKNLEIFLSEKKTETVKLVANADKRHVASTPVRIAGNGLSVSGSASQAPIPSIVAAPKVSQPAPTFTEEQKRQATEKRETETRQLEARLGRLPLFKKSGDGIAYTVPIEPRRRSELPAGVQAIKTISFFVPLLYPLQPCRVQLDGVDSLAAKDIEAGFNFKARQSEGLTLMGRINYFAQNMHTMATLAPHQEPTSPPVITTEPVSGLRSETSHHFLTGDDDRGHIKVIPRPPEWEVEDDSDEISDSDDYTYDSGDEDSGEGGIDLADDPSKSLATQITEKGTAISFPFIELYGIELLEVSTLNITVKCERCKETTDIHNLKDSVPTNESCRKCATQLSITFRRDLIHANAVRAGFIDLTGCTPVDMLPSSFTPTCSECSTAYPVPGIISVRGETTSNVCRECHQKFTFKIPEIKFLRISTAHIPSAQGPRRKRETLGLVAGTELPRRGRCKHYSKSLRWFRFSCCQKVYPCDRCHDESEEHGNEHANRMICGLCSREQNYRPEDCGICHGVVVGKKGSGFWEGGKGTRDRVRMSRKDKRKFRRAPREGGGVGKSATSGIGGRK